MACLGVAPAVGQAYPDRLIRIVVPFAAGGPVDVMARLVAQRMAVILGQNVIIENRAGGGGVIGAKAVANAEPDGYTLLFGNVSTLAVIPAVARNKDYDPAKNFAPVAKVSDSPEVLVVDRSFPARTVQDLVTIARNNPGKLNFGSSGFGNATHLAAEWFKAKTAVDVVHVPYKGLSEVVTGVLAGQVTFGFGAIEGLMPHIQDGQLRALAVTSEKRFPLLPELPTMIESGVDGFVVSSFQGVVAPAGTPPAVVAETQRRRQCQHGGSGDAGPARPARRHPGDRHAAGIRGVLRGGNAQMGGDRQIRRHQHRLARFTTPSMSLPGLTGQSSTPGRCLLDRPVKPGDDREGMRQAMTSDRGVRPGRRN